MAMAGSRGWGSGIDGTHNEVPADIVRTDVVDVNRGTVLLWVTIHGTRVPGS